MFYIQNGGWTVSKKYIHKPSEPIRRVEIRTSAAMESWLQKGKTLRKEELTYLTDIFLVLKKRWDYIRIKEMAFMGHIAIFLEKETIHLTTSCCEVTGKKEVIVRGRKWDHQFFEFKVENGVMVLPSSFFQFLNKHVKMERLFKRLSNG